jgi:oligopeptide transport system ATP-binding protein
MPPGKIVGGKALFGGHDLLKLSQAELRKIRGKRIGMIFQDPMTCLNPFMRIDDQLVEPLIIHEKASKNDALKRAEAVLEEVGILDVKQRLKAFPHEMSGGMRQRIMIAMALIGRPELLIADEPTTALDVTVQAQILDLIRRLQKENNMGVVFITHDLGVVAGMADTVAVMYAGQVVESGATDDIFYNNSHPYTRALLDSIPASVAPGGELYSIPGLPPNVSRTPRGCSFAPRCRVVVGACRKTRTELKVVQGNHYSSCLRVQEGSL